MKENEEEEIPVCSLCQLAGATIKTEPQAPDWKTLWFHRDCFWKLQEMLYE